MAQTKRSKANVPVNRIEGYIDEPNPLAEWSSFPRTMKNFPDLFLLACHHGFVFQPKTAEDAVHRSEGSDWTKLARELVERLSLENRVEIVEKELKEVSTRLARIESLCEKAFQKPVSVPISTFAPEPFEIIREFSVVVQPEEDSYVATLFDANISSSGETQEEAVANVKDLILMIFKGFEDENDSELGPAMIRQKYTLLSLIRRK